MSTQDNENLPVQDELAVLKERADKMGLRYHPSISAEKLREKITAALNDEQESDTQTQDDTPAQPMVAVEETEAQHRARKRREANELVRVRVTCMNPAKREWEGEIFTAGNSLVGSFRKYVPFNADEGWHVPRIILKQIQQRQCQIFTTVRDNRGNSVRKGKLIKEFAVEIMPNLTVEELEDLAQRQAMAKTID